jgi:hypothetical protein
LQVTMQEKSTGTSLSQTSGDLVDAAIVFDGIPEGDWTVTSQTPAGQGRPVVFCALFDGTTQGDYERFDSADSGADTGAAFARVVWLAPNDTTSGSASFRTSLSGDDALTCEWFFLPGTDQSTDAPGGTSVTGQTGAPGRQQITLVLKNCPVLYRGTDYGTDCVEPAGNVRFAVLGDGVENGEIDIRTDGQGVATFDLPYTGSDVVLVEQAIPQSVNLSYLLGCVRDGQTFETPFFPAYIVSIAGNIKLIVPNGSAITCTWINIPSQAQSLVPIDRSALVLVMPRSLSLEFAA